MFTSPNRQRTGGPTADALATVNPTDMLDTTRDRTARYHSTVQDPSVDQLAEWAAGRTMHEDKR
jgi:hypothetical protein